MGSPYLDAYAFLGTLSISQCWLFCFMILDQLDKSGVRGSVSQKSGRLKRQLGHNQNPDEGHQPEMAADIRLQTILEAWFWACTIFVPGWAHVI